jgi:hypothetical protein
LRGGASVVRKPHSHGKRSDFGISGQRLKFSLVSAENLNIYPLAQIARACGRVSVGGDPDKRPVNRQKKPAAGGEPANPAKRGTRLKATTDRAFSSLSASKADVPKRLVYLAARAEGSSSHPNEGHSNLRTSVCRAKSVHGAAPDRVP